MLEKGDSNPHSILFSFSAYFKPKAKESSVHSNLYWVPSTCLALFLDRRIQQ